MNFKTLKANARKSLEGKWKNTVLITLIFGVIIGVASTIDNTISSKMFEPTVINGIEYRQSFSIITIVVTALIGLGFSSYFLRVSRNETPEIEELFSKTSLFGGYLLLIILTAIFVSLWTLLLIIPGIIASISYSMASLIKLDNQDMKAMDCIRKSKEMMKGHKWEYFKLMFSFIGWIILGIFTFGILYFWLMPYMMVTECNFYNELLKEKK